ncbi:MAG: hypothetical protein HY898_24520 [Deltaproteobacteria bacterium]|nr:hypothetical protein [Deltaproteobacteria bacterium]
MSESSTPRHLSDANAWSEHEEESGVRDWEALGLRPRHRTPPIPVNTLSKCLRQSLPSQRPAPRSSPPQSFAPPSFPPRSPLPSLHSQDCPTDRTGQEPLFEVSSPFASQPPPPPTADSSRPARVTIESQARAMREAMARGDDESALLMGEALLALIPGDLHVGQCVAWCRRSLERRFLKRLGGAHQIPIPLVRGEPVQCLPLEPKEAFVLSLVDGATTVDDIVDISGMARVDALRTLWRLCERDVIWVEA